MRQTPVLGYCPGPKTARCLTTLGEAVRAEENEEKLPELIHHTKKSAELRDVLSWPPYDGWQTSYTVGSDPISVDYLSRKIDPFFLQVAFLRVESHSRSFNTFLVRL